MGFLKNPHAFLRVLKAVLDVTEHRFILFSSGYEPLDAAIQSIACESSNRANPPPSNIHGTLLFSDRLYCFSGFVNLWRLKYPYLFLIFYFYLKIHKCSFGLKWPVRYLIAGSSLNAQLQFIMEAGKDLNVVFDLYMSFLGTMCFT